MAFILKLYNVSQRSYWAFNGNGSSSFPASLSAFVNHILEGKTPVSVRPLFFGASLVALKKKVGGIRPISLLDVPFVVLLPNVQEVKRDGGITFSKAVGVWNKEGTIN